MHLQNKFSTGVVVSYGRGVDLNMDHHRGHNYGTLWTQLDFGKGTRSFDSGGSSNRGIHAGAYTTFWNLAAAGNQLGDLENDLGPGLNFVGERRGGAIGHKRAWLDASTLQRMAV